MLTAAVLSSVCGYAYEPLVSKGQIWNHSVVSYYGEMFRTPHKMNSARQLNCTAKHTTL